MRIVVHGQQAFGKAVLEKLLERGEDVVGVFCAPDKEGRPTDPLKEFALEKGLPLHQPASWKTPEAEARMRSFEPDLRSEEHTSELQSLMRISYAVYCLKKTNDA